MSFNKLKKSQEKKAVKENKNKSLIETLEFSIKTLELEIEHGRERVAVIDMVTDREVLPSSITYKASLVNCFLTPERVEKKKEEIERQRKQLATFKAGNIVSKALNEKKEKPQN
jgi:hypothetical protein